MLGVLAFLAIGAVPLARYLLRFPEDQWLVDVEVYREAAVSVLEGRPIYAQMTQPPQLLPFTYPPFAALLALPLAAVPFRVAGWSWTIAQLVADLAIVWVAWHHLRSRAAAWAPLLVGVVAGAFLWTQPVGDGIRFAQVNAFLVLACLLDLRRPRPRLLRALPAGVLVGLAMAIKLTPGVFVIHYLLCRRWREAATAVGTAVAVTLVTWLVLPGASFAFWGGALSDPSRLGSNEAPPNQSFRGLLLRRGLDGTALTLAWLPWLLLAGAAAFWVARRAWRQGDWVAEAAAVGLAGFLLSPVSWVHHLHWILVIVPAILGAAAGRDDRRAPSRDRRRDVPRYLAAATIFGWFVATLPFWGVLWVREKRSPAWLGPVLTEGAVIGSVLTLALLAWAVHRTDRERAPAPAPRSVAPRERTKVGA